jgi:hypothetical protein
MEIAVITNLTIEIFLRIYVYQPYLFRTIEYYLPASRWEHLTCAMSINAYSSQKLENLEPDHKEK